MSRTIVCLGVKRSGTTAVHQAFAAHPEVVICHPDRGVDNWEPNFWNSAAEVLTCHRQRNGHVVAAWSRFVHRLAQIAPDLRSDPPLDEERVFALWDAVARRYGPVVFDKSPPYLSAPATLALLRAYLDRGADVRFFALVRDPRQVIASQYELWKDIHPAATPASRDRAWAACYRNLEEFRAAIGGQRCPVIRYEDLAADPDRWMKRIYDHCGIADRPESYAHIRPAVAGRLETSRDSRLRAWTPSRELRVAAKAYGYDLDPPAAAGEGAGAAAPAERSGEVPAPGTARNRSRAPWRRLKSVAAAVFRQAVGRLPAARLESLIVEAVVARIARIPAKETLRLLLRLDQRLYGLHGRAAVAYGGGVHTKHRHTGYHDFFVARLARGERVLDAGCGNGSLAHSIAVWAEAQVVALDVSAENIAEGRRRFLHPRIEYRIGDVRSEPAAERFDAVILSNLLEHLADRPRFLSDLGARTRAARILIRVPLFERDWRVPLKQELGIDWRLDPTHEIEYTLESFAAEIAEAGFGIVHQEVRWGEIWAEVAPMATG